MLLIEHLLSQSDNWVLCGPFVEHDMKRIFILFVIIFSCAGIPAKESQYEIMKKNLDENSLPLVNLIVDITKVNKKVYVAGEIEIVDYQRRIDPTTDTKRFHCKYKIRGATASTFDKKSFSVKLYDELGEDLDADVFGIRKENSWILDAMAVDRIRMRNRVCFDVWNEMSKTPYDTKYENRNGTKGVFVEVFINGNYNGLYCMTDKIDRKLLGLKKAQVSDEDDVYIRGLLYKGKTWNGFTDIWLRSYSEADTSKDTWNGWELQYPDDYPSTNTWRPLMDLIDFCSDLTTNETFVQEYKDYFYIENLVDYAVFTMALNVRDNAYKNTFLSVVDITQGHRYMLTPWDMDYSFGGSWDGSYSNATTSINRYDNIAPFNRLAVQNIDGFKDLEAITWKKYCSTLFSCESITRRLDYYAEQFTSSGAWKREYEKWNGNPVPLKENITDELEYVKEWYAMNYKKLCAQFDEIIATDIKVASHISSAKVVYMLDGRRIDENAMRKGVYIINGKKVLVK